MAHTTVGPHRLGRRILLRRIRLHPTVFAPRQARRFVYRLGEVAGLPERLVDDAALAIGDMVTEGVRHSGREIEVILEVVDQTMIVRARDTRVPGPSVAGAGRRAPDGVSPTVRRLAESWGSHRSRHGWEVWAVLSTTRLGLAHAG